MSTTDPFISLAEDQGLLDVPDLSPERLSERYLYSWEMTYRYSFARWWGTAEPGTSDVWVLLNPATGDTEQRRRPTLDRCITRSRTDGRTGVIIVNLFAYRDTDPKALSSAADPVGPANDDALRVFTGLGARTIAAWGSHNSLLGRSAQVAPLLDTALCLGTTRLGQPRHPLHVPSDTELIPWTSQTHG